MSGKTREETDSMGVVEVPVQALYGAQTQRAVNNFSISEERMPLIFLKALIILKRSGAIAHGSLGTLPNKQVEAIIEAADQLLEGDFSIHFPVSLYQTGSGTSTNMNVNEVISGIAKAKGVIVNPNDHVNKGQSSNDIIPTALYLCSLMLIRDTIIPALDHFISGCQTRSSEFQSIIKTGRTHLMDALPIKLSDELTCWAYQMSDARQRFLSVYDRLREVPLGGTAVGSGVNCPKSFPEKVFEATSDYLDIELESMKSPFQGLSGLDSILEFSGHLKNCGSTLLKIANDLRWMNSGPRAGIGEIILPPLQPGSSIMPDKVNPVIPEAVAMACVQITGNDTTITLAAQSGSFQLNTMFPIAAGRIVQSATLLSRATVSLFDQAIAGMKINEQGIKEPLLKNPILVTALAPLIGYQKSAAIAHMAREQDCTVMEVALRETDLAKEQLEKLLDPAQLASGG